jgi:2-polyprenyl-3-methyl-5-hydroxy-6-metoxy-1,4-benzoquinol methylase
MFSVFKRPFASPNAVIYSYELSKLFVDDSVTSILKVGCGIGIFAIRYASSHKNIFVTGVDQSARTIEFLSSNYGKYYNNLELRRYDFAKKALSWESF